jgi:hypothetical protein
MVMFENPFRPGAGHHPPYLAGRSAEQDDLKRLLRQRVVHENLILTGLRGVGKTALLTTFQPIAMQAGWLWAGTDLSESASLTEERLATRIMADIALVTAAMVYQETKQMEFGFAGTEKVLRQPLDFDILKARFDRTPGLISDKLKAVLEFVWSVMPQQAISGIVFAYDEAQNLSDHAEKDEFPLSILLEVFQSLQRKNLPLFLILSGLPTLFPKLVDARTYAERMFHVMFLRQLAPPDAREAIVRPILDKKCPITFHDDAVQRIVEMSGGYPALIQFICKEVFDVWIARITEGAIPDVPADDIIRKLDNDFFSGRWTNVPDRQRELLQVVAALENCDGEFTVQDIVKGSKVKLKKPFSASHVGQVLVDLGNSGLVYRIRHGKYSLAVPLLSQFIRRQELEPTV